MTAINLFYDSLYSYIQIHKRTLLIASLHCCQHHSDENGQGQNSQLRWANTPALRTLSACDASPGINGMEWAWAGYGRGRAEPCPYHTQPTLTPYHLSQGAETRQERKAPLGLEDLG